MERNIDGLIHVDIKLVTTGVYFYRTVIVIDFYQSGKILIILDLHVAT